MNDALIKGTGNSRYLKSVENFLTLYPTYQDFVSALVAGTLPVDFNGINPAGWHQLGTALNKANLLRDTTAAQFGLGVDAVPNDILSFVGKYNEYWWSLLHGEAYSYYQEKQELNANAVSVESASYYSKTITINQSNGTVSLVNPTTLAYAHYQSDITNLLKTLCENAPLYYQVGSTIFYVPAGATYDDTEWFTTDTTFSGWRNSSTDVSYVVVNAATNSQICARRVSTEIINVPAGAVTYEHSADRNAYPDSGTVDGITYQFLGIPFQKFPAIPQIETGSYVGNGTYGSDNQNSLTFKIKPKIVFLSCDANAYTQSGFNAGTYTVYLMNPSNCALVHAGNFNSSLSWSQDGFVCPLAVSWNGTSVSWYSFFNSSYQFNDKGKTYHYLAIGY